MSDGNTRAPSAVPVAPRPFIVLVCGGSASGKTRLARHMRDAIGARRATIVQEDAYYLPAAARGSHDTARYNFDRPETKDFALLRTHLDRSRAGEPFDLPHYDFSRHDRTGETTRIGPPAVLIVEGMHGLGDARVRQIADLTVFVAAGRLMRRARRIARDVAERGRDADETARQFDAVVEPMHLRYVEPLRRHSQHIVANLRDDVAALQREAEALAARIERALSAA